MSRELLAAGFFTVQPKNIDIVSEDTRRPKVFSLSLSLYEKLWQKAITVRVLLLDIAIYGKFSKKKPEKHLTWDSKNSLSLHKGGRQSKIKKRVPNNSLSARQDSFFYSIKEFVTILRCGGYWILSLWTSERLIWNW